MISEELIPLETSEKVRFPRSAPFIMLRVNGASYINKKAAGLLGLVHGDMLRFHRSPDGKFFIAKAVGALGSDLTKSGGCLQFCDTKVTRAIFQAFDVDATHASFPLSPAVEEKNTSEGMVPTLMIIPKPFNKRYK